MREVTLIDSGSAPVPAMLMAVATDRTEGAGNERALRAIERFQAAIVDGTQTDMAARLKAAFRSVNGDVFSSDPGEISLVAMVARGKYASFAAVGDNKAFLYRADRLNEVTRNQRIERGTARRSDQRTPETQYAPQFLGVQERLESRLPSIFDITLLPRDSVALVSGSIEDQDAQGAASSALVSPGQTLARTIERSLATTGDPDNAATVLEVLPVREAMAEAPAASLTTPTYLPYVIIALVMLASLALALWFFFV